MWETVAGLETRARLATVRRPTLVLVGDRDESTPPEAGRLLARSIPGAAIEVIQGASHMLPIEVPDAFGAALERFLPAG